MEGNIYNKISQEINFKLPDINFDSDSDDTENDKPIKPYIRPAAEILFGWDSSENEELMEILSKMPSDPVVTTKDESVTPIELSTETDIRTVTTEKIPFKNISLPNGIRSHISSDLDDRENRILLTNFGLRDNLDLDKVLDEIDLSNYQSSFFEDVLDNDDDSDANSYKKSESASALLTRLDEMSKKYEESRQNTNNSNAEYPGKSSAGISLSNLFNQLKYESTMDTVILDLRVENDLWATKIDQETSKEFVKHINEIIKEEESSDDDDSELTVDQPNQNDLWICNYRKSKTAYQNKNSKEMGTKTDIVNSMTNDKFVEKTENKAKTETKMCVEKKQIVVESKLDHEPDQTMSENVRIKIEKIKQREKVLSERRTIGYRLSRMLPVSEDCPILLHEEISFDPWIMSLLPTAIDCGPNDQGQFFRAIILLSAPNIVLTMSKVPSPICDGFPNENFAAILSVMLQLTRVSSTNRPFTVIGLQQIYYEDQLQLSLLCRTDLSITNLKTDLKKYSLKDLVTESSGPCQFVSELPLSNLMRILPYNSALDSNIWNWNNSSVVWKKMVEESSVYDDRNGCRPLEINTSCVVLQEQFFLSRHFFELIMKLLERCWFSGIRLIYDSDGQKQMVLAVRGYDSVNVIKILQNKSSLYRANVTCTRFEENSLKELVKYFGPRLSENKIVTMFEDHRDLELANELSDGLSIYHSLYVTNPSDIVLIVSPMCLDIGWIINTLLTSGGYRLVNMTRLHLSISEARELGINEQLVDSFDAASGPCHFVILRNEQPLHSINSALVECRTVIHNDDKSMPNLDHIFYSLPYSKLLLDLLNLQKIAQTPSIRELVLNIPDAPFDDCEQCSFVLLISDELTRHLAQLLDQMSNLDLLAVKCMTRWPTDDHLALIQSQFGLRLPILNSDHIFEETEGKMRIVVLVVRSMFLIKELEKIQSIIRAEKNLIFAYTMNVSVTFGMVGSFFTSSELISDPRRRSSLQFLPDEITSQLATVSVLAQYQLIYSPVTSALSVRVNDVHSVATKFRQMWFLLTREGFSVTDAVLDKTMHLLFIVKRPNAIFYLIQWSKSHFSDSDSVTIANNAEEIEEIQSRTVNHEISEKMTKSLSYNGSSDNIVFIMLDESLLDSSPDMIATTKVFWSFLEENDYNSMSLCLRTVVGSDIFKLKDISLRNLSGGQMTNETRYLCLLVTGNIIATVIEDLLKCKIKSLNTESRLTEDIYLCRDNNQILQCCDILMKGVAVNQSNVNVCFN